MWRSLFVHLNFYIMTPYHHVHPPEFNSSRVTKSASLDWLQEQILWKIIVLLALVYLVWCDKVSIVLGEMPQNQAGLAHTGNPIRTALLSLGGDPPAQTVCLPPETQSNLTHVLDPSFAKRNGVESKLVAEKASICQTYIQRFAPVAIAEMRRTGLPASITLAQGLLESDAGQSAIAKSINNHFGIKCFSRKCKKGHCKNYTDDSHKDFFIRYDNAWESYRAHTEFLKNSHRYQSLFKLGPLAYQKWANGLAAAGYASDPQYAMKLIAIIQQLQLDKLDKKFK